ncbi:hypothetical protein BDV3_003803 [Batrachochytrium dendrobatidis]
MTSQSPQKYSIAVPKYKRDVLLHPYTQHAIQLFKSYSFPSIETAILTPGISPYPSWIASAACAVGALGTLRSIRLSKNYMTVGLLGIYSAIFTGTGWMTCLDTTNGPSTTAAWGTLYLLTSASGTFTKPKIGPVAIYATVATTTISYLMETFGFND